MEFFSKMPHWLGTAIVGGVSAAIGFLAKELWRYWKKHRESEQARRLRLEQLDGLLDESGSLFRSQRAQARRLFESIERYHISAVKPGLSLDQVFSLAFSQFSPEEAQLHAIIRGVTATSLRRINVEMAHWLKGDNWFKRAHHSPQLDRLSKELRQLELHLNEWHAKFSSVFEDDKTLALNYLADEQKHGTGFPIGIEKVVQEALKDI
jgi:hypothetical protein